MKKVKTLFLRNLKEVFRDPIIYIFCLTFPIIMLLLFQIINKYAAESAIFNLSSLIPAIIMFSYSFVMLVLTLTVSKDRATQFLKRLCVAPIRFYHFLLAYCLLGLLIGILQTVLCIVAGFIISLFTGVTFFSLAQIFLLVLTQLPMLIINVLLGIIFGTIFNDKTAPGVSSIIISTSGILGGCWMPLEVMGGLESFCRCLPFYPSVFLGRIVTQATNSLNTIYVFDSKAILGLITIFAYMLLCILLSCLLFKQSMKNIK